MNRPKNKTFMSQRFRGFLPVVVDVETSGLNPLTDALLEIAVVTLKFDASEKLVLDKTFAYHVDPFLGANMDPEALEITKIDPTYPLRFSVSEKHALHCIFREVREAMAAVSCERAVLVGHNAWFDLSFVQMAARRSQLQANPFHSFTTLDTATLSAVLLGETVLARAVRAAKIQFDETRAHSAIYDALKTAELFCWLVNQTPVPKLK